MRRRGLAATAATAALLLAGCDGGTTPEGLVEALDADGIGMDPSTSPERYYAAVENLCDADADFPDSVLRGFAHEDNADALRRMVVGMNYVCGDNQGEDLANMVEMTYGGQ